MSLASVPVVCDSLGFAASRCVWSDADLAACGWTPDLAAAMKPVAECMERLATEAETAERLRLRTAGNGDDTDGVD